MPDWIENDLHIEGLENELLRFKEHARSPTEPKNILDANQFIPYPEKYREMDARDYERLPGFNSGGYEWCKENWGTKWGFVHPTLESDAPAAGRLQYQFLSAWTPPEPLVLKMSEMFPELTFGLNSRYPGNLSSETYICQGGKEATDEV